MSRTWMATSLRTRMAIRVFPVASAQRRRNRWAMWRKCNTLFIFTTDENDHLVGGAPTPVNCDGVTTPCNYFYPGTSNRSVGELTTNLDSVLFTQQPRTPVTQFLVHADDAPAIYIETHLRPIRSPAISSRIWLP